MANQVIKEGSSPTLHNPCNNKIRESVINATAHPVFDFRFDRSMIEEFPGSRL